MPSLEASYPELVTSLEREYGQLTQRSEGHEGFPAVVMAALGRPCGVDRDRCERTLRPLEQAGLLEADALARAEPIEIHDTLNQGGVTIPLKTAVVLCRLAAWFARTFPGAGQWAETSSPPTSRLRAELLAINGIGPGTADAILLALGRPCFPIDRGVYRILVRHGWCDLTADYDEASQCLSRQGGGDPAEIDRLARRLSRVGSRFCGVKVPKCARCPLRELLPESGPIDPQG
jgi:endonuclease-3 related protein